MGFCVDLTSCGPATVEIVGHSGPGSQPLVAYLRGIGTPIMHANIDDIELPELAALLPND